MFSGGRERVHWKQMWLTLKGNCAPPLTKWDEEISSFFKKKIRHLVLLSILLLIALGREGVTHVEYSCFEKWNHDHTKVLFSILQITYTKE